jgi:dUTP pyrophosphatase
MILEYHRTRGDVIPPTRANPSDAGLDVFYNPEHPECVGAHLEPGESRLFSTGLKFGVPHGYMLEVKNRSGNAYKRSLLVGACVVDSGYSGEIFVNLHNVGTKPQFVERGTKVAQIVMIPVVHFRALESKSDNLYDWYPITMSQRGDSSLGSTDKKVPDLSTKDIDPFNLPKPWELGDPT